MLSVIMLSVIMLSVIMLSVIMLSDIMLSVVMLSVIMLSVVLLSVVASKYNCGSKLKNVCKNNCYGLFYTTSVSIFVNLQIPHFQSKNSSNA